MRVGTWSWWMGNTKNCSRFPTGWRKKGKGREKLHMQPMYVISPEKDTVPCRSPISKLSSAATTPSHIPSYPTAVEPHRCGDGDLGTSPPTLAPVMLEWLGLSPPRLAISGLAEGWEGVDCISFVHKADDPVWSGGCVPVPPETHTTASTSVNAESWNCIIPKRCRVPRVISYILHQSKSPSFPAILHSIGLVPACQSSLRIWWRSLSWHSYMQAIDNTYATPHTLFAILWPVLTRQ